MPEPYRLHHHADFSRTVRRGHRIGRRDLVLHAAGRASVVEGDVRLDYGGPRFGLIVGKTVGNAVVRHRVSRRLRHICAGAVAAVPAEFDVVIRALPGAASASSADLAAQFHSGLRRLAPRAGDRRS